MPAEKPPLGVEPKRFHAERRMKDLARAIYEYTNFAFIVGVALSEYPQIFEWIEELGELSRFLRGIEQKAKAEELEELASRNTLSLKEMDSNNTTTEFMALTMRALRQIYYKLYAPFGIPQHPEVLMAMLYEFEQKLKERLGDGA